MMSFVMFRKIAAVIIIGVVAVGCAHRYDRYGACGAGCISESRCLSMASDDKSGCTKACPTCCCSCACGAPEKVAAASKCGDKTVKPPVKKSVSLTVPKKSSSALPKTAKASMRLKPAAAPKVTAVSSKTAEIKSVQKALNDRGARLETDGIMGERTVRLLKAFQTINDLPVTGEADTATLKALGIAN